MKWRGRRASSNVEDRRGQSSGGASGGGAANLLLLIGSRFGLKGIIIVAVGFFALWKLGIVDPTFLIEGGTSGLEASSEISPEEQERFDFVSVVLADTEDVWKAEFAKAGRSYRSPTLVIYRGQTRTACGQGSATMGPFYCPVDEKIYVDLTFYDELEQTFRAPGDFAQAYVIAHEVGHHVQKLLGFSEMVQSKRGQPDYNEWSVRLELQADFLAGLWAHHQQQYLEEGDIEEAMRAANAIGDDAIQLKARGKVVPHAFTHGSSEQRMRWFMKGLQSGKFEDGDTFSGSYESL